LDLEEHFLGTITDENSVSGWLLLIDIDMDMENPAFICLGN
jgi:hypothetical protein